MLSAPLGERRLLWLLAAVQFTLLLDFMILMPLGPELMRALHIEPSAFGALVSAYTLASALVGLSGALWLDRVAPGRTLLQLDAGFILATLGCAAAPNAAWLLVCRLLAGACAGLLWALNMAIIVNTVPAERRGRAIGLVMSSYAASAVAGVPLGLALASQFGWRAPFLAVAALAAVLWLLLSRLLPGQAANQSDSLVDGEPAHTTRALVGLWRPDFVLGWMLTFCVVSAGFLLIPYLSTFMRGNLGVPASSLSWVYLCGGSATFFFSRLVGRWVDRFGAIRILSCLLVATVVPHLWFTHLRTTSLLPVLVVFALFMTLTSGRIIPTIALITSRVPPEMRGRFMAVNTATSDAAAGLAAWASGTLLGTTREGALVGFGMLGWMAVGVTALALCLVWQLQRSQAQVPAALTLTEA